MQFKHNQFSKNIKLSTVVPVNDSIPKEIMGNASQPNQQDYLDINLTYCGEPSITVVNSFQFCVWFFFHLFFHKIKKEVKHEWRNSTIHIY